MRSSRSLFATVRLYSKQHENGAARVPHFLRSNRVEPIARKGMHHITSTQRALQSSTLGKGPHAAGTTTRHTDAVPGRGAFARRRTRESTMEQRMKEKAIPSGWGADEILRRL